MADTGAKFATATGDDYNQWATPTNAYSNSGTYATETTNAQQQDWYNFSFGLTDEEIDGIEVKVEAKSGDWFGSLWSIDVELSWNGGTSYTSTGKTTGTLTTSDVVYTLGGSSDTWGRSWSASEFSNTNFRIRLNAQQDGASFRTVSVDYITVKVFYTPSGTDWTKDLSDSVGITEVVIKKPVKIINDSFSLSESISPDVTYSLRLLADYWEITFTSSIAWTKDLSDSFGLSDSNEKTIGSVLSDNVGISDLISNGMSIPLSDGMDLADDIINGIGLIRAESMLISDSLLKTVGLVISDTVNISDLIETSAPSNYQKSLSDTITFAEAIQNAIGHMIVDSVDLSDSEVSLVGKTLSDDIGVSDAISEISSGKYLTSSLNITDSEIQSAGLGLSDSITISDALDSDITIGLFINWCLRIHS